VTALDCRGRELRIGDTLRGHGAMRARVIGFALADDGRMDVVIEHTAGLSVRRGAPPVTRLTLPERSQWGKDSGGAL